MYDRKTMHYFKYLFRRGKSLPAHILDTGLGSLMALLLLTLAPVLWGAALRASLALACFFTVGGLLLWSLLRSYRFSRFVARKTEAMRRTLLLEGLCLLPAAEFRSICRRIFLRRPMAEQPQPCYGGLYYPKAGLFCYAFQMHPAAQVGISQISLLHRVLLRLNAKACCLLCAAPYTPEAKAFCTRLGIPFTFLEKEALLREAEYRLPPISTAALQAAFARERQQFYAAHRFSQTAIAPGRHRTYLCYAFFLLCWYFLFRLSVLYPIAAAVCCLLAALSYAKKPSVTEQWWDFCETDDKSRTCGQ